MDGSWYTGCSWEVSLKIEPFNNPACSKNNKNEKTQMLFFFYKVDLFELGSFVSAEVWRVFCMESTDLARPIFIFAQAYLKD